MTPDRAPLAARRSRAADLERFAPAMFVALWSTGFVVAHYATEDAGPLTFLAVRLCAAGVLLWIIALVTGAPAISVRDVRWAAIAGLGMNALYLGGVFVAISHGLPTGLSALISGLHPVLTSVVARFVLGERVRRIQTVGIALGVAGVTVVVVAKLGSGTGAVTAGALVAMTISVLGMSAGTIVQRSRGASVPLLRGTAVQFLASSFVLAIGAVLDEHWRFHPTARLWFSLAWATIVLSMASVLIMLMLLQRQAAARVSSLFFLVPALSTIEGAILFGEHIGAIIVIGLLISLAGVFLTTRQPR